jgi:hypothetical protein
MKTRRRHYKQRGGVTPFRMQKVTRTCPIKKYKHPNNCAASSYRILGIVTEEQAAEFSRRTGDGMSRNHTVALLNQLYPGSNFQLFIFKITDETLEKLEPMLYYFLSGLDNAEDMTSGLLAGIEYSDSGHSITCMKSKGKVRIVDNQTNENVSFQNYFKDYVEDNIENFRVFLDVNSDIYKRFQTLDYNWFVANSTSTGRKLEKHEKSFLRLLDPPELKKRDEFINMYIDHTVKVNRLKILIDKFATVIETITELYDTGLIRHPVQIYHMYKNAIDYEKENNLIETLMYTFVTRTDMPSIKESSNSASTPNERRMFISSQERATLTKQAKDYLKTTRTSEAIKEYVLKHKHLINGLERIETKLDTLPNYPFDDDSTIKKITPIIKSIIFIYGHNVIGGMTKFEGSDASHKSFTSSA